MSPRPALVLGLDVGGTKIAGGVVSLPDGRVVARRTIPTGAGRGGRAVLDDVLHLARDLIADTTLATQAVAFVGLGICELVDRHHQLASAQTIAWLDQPVHAELSSFGPFHLEADVRAAAIAEATLGSGRTFQNFLYVTVGTGISCCLMLDGQPYLGAHGATGTMASSPITVPFQENPTSTADAAALTTKTLEELASGPALVKRFNAAGGRAARGHDVTAAAMAGDPAAVWVIRSATEALGSQVALLVGTLDPEAVIVGGGLGLVAGLYWEQFVASTRRHIWSDQQRGLPIVQASTGADAGWLGAAIAAWQSRS